MNHKLLGQMMQRILSRINLLLGKKHANDPMLYEGVRLTPEDIASESFKQYLGGGKEQWEQRGRFQLLFLKTMGLLPSSHFLDIGCGPLRAGVHLIDYLDVGHYMGFDYNTDFITAAWSIVENRGLANKSPKLACISDFGSSGLAWDADFALAFSVLNHCSEPERHAFFQCIPTAHRTKARLYITHALWRRPSHLKSSGLKITKTINSDFIDITQHGWEGRDDIFPIHELTKIEAGSCC